MQHDINNGMKGCMMITPLDSAIENQPLIKSILEQFTEIISKKENDAVNCGLMNGLAGNLLFLLKVNEFNSNFINEQTFSHKLDFLQEHLSAYVNHLSLSRGLSGQSWFLEFINQAQGEDYDAELCEEIDDILVNAVTTESWQGEIEMVLGLSGIAMYAGRRIKKHSSSKLFEIIISHYENLAIKTSENTLSWSQPKNSVYRFNKDDPDNLEFNLGLAHGMPSIIASLIPALNIPSLYDRTKTLLIQSCDWLIEQELDQAPGESSIACFNSYCTGSLDKGKVVMDKKKSGSRLGWCYGDLTIALTLARVGNALELPSYLEKAKSISHLATKRDSVNAAILDAGLCHGSAGVALIFQLLYQQLHEPELLKTANKWLVYTLDLYQEKGIEGLYMYSAIADDYQADSSLLMGFSGIGLCLLSALGGEPDWADCLLMN